jgi:hypothetical protein
VPPTGILVPTSTRTAGTTGTLSTTEDGYTVTSSTRLSDYPECTGRYHRWYPSKAKFKGTANGQGYGEVLEKYSPGDPILVSKEFLIIKVHLFCTETLYSLRNVISNSCNSR